MEPDDAAVTRTAEAAVRELLDGRPVVISGGPLAGLVRRLDQAREFSGGDVFVLGFGRGTGPLPDLTTTPVHVIEQTSPDPVTEIREQVRVLADLPADAVAALDAWDPQRRAQILGGPFVTARTVAGRRVLDGRLEEWAVLEDKTRSDALWTAAGVRRPAAEVVDADVSSLRAAHRRLDEGAGTVWSGDTRAGFNGAASHVRRVHRDEQVEAVAQWFAGECDRVRVMPFLDGIPCSAHGIVLPDGVTVLRPVEQVVLRRGEDSTFVYAGISTHWDPSPGDREEIRAAVRKVGHVLARDHGFRGAYSVDGVLTRSGWLPTELNPRFSGGMGTIGRGIPDFPLMLLQAVLVSGASPGLTAVALERTVLAAADEFRNGSVHAGSPVLAAPAETSDLPVVFSPDGSALHRADPGETASTSLMLGPSGFGAFLRLDVGPGSVPSGTSLGPLAVATLALADEQWGTGFGPLVSARPARL